jgi:ABC-type transport system involved in multi-copper enzyme maturation permease subunit
VSLRDRLRDALELVALSGRLVGGRRFWLGPLLPLLWPAFQAIRLVVGWREEVFEPVSAQSTLIGVPLVVLAIGLGVRVIAGEVDRRTLEIAYTVPGGSQRVWLSKLAAAAALLAASEVLLAVVTFAFFTSFPPGALYGALQSALVFLVVGMALAALFANEVTGAMATVVVLLVASLPGGGSRLSPFFNPLAVEETSAVTVLAWTVQNRVGYALAIAAITALAFARAERREKLLAG